MEIKVVYMLKARELDSAELNSKVRLDGRWILRSGGRMPVASKTQAYGDHLLACWWEGGEEGSAKGREIFGGSECQHTKNWDNIEFGGKGLETHTRRCPLLRRGESGGRGSKGGTGGMSVFAAQKGIYVKGRGGA